MYSRRLHWVPTPFWLAVPMLWLPAAAAQKVSPSIHRKFSPSYATPWRWPVVQHYPTLRRTKSAYVMKKSLSVKLLLSNTPSYGTGNWDYIFPFRIYLFFYCVCNRPLTNFKEKEWTFYRFGVPMKWTNRMRGRTKQYLGEWIWVSRKRPGYRRDNWKRYWTYLSSLSQNGSFPKWKIQSRSHAGFCSTNTIEGPITRKSGMHPIEG